jgi:cytochrome c oxidase cbb3-type subunit III
MSRSLLLALVMVAASGIAFAQGDSDAALLLASPNTIDTSPALLARVNQLAEDALNTHCTGCHGTDLKGSKGIPDLTDYDWLWGITGAETTSTEPVFEIMQTILYGIRDRNCADEVKRYGACPDTRYSEMPAYGSPDIGFSAEQIDELVEYVMMLSGQEFDAAAVERGAPNISLCAECHAADGLGYKPYGGPDLTDGVWLYGGTREDIRDVITNGRLGTCPPWAGTLDFVTIKALAVHLYRKSQGY